MADRKQKPRIGSLSTVGDLLTEMGRVYRLTRRGEIAIDRGAKLVHMLSLMRAVLEVVSLEERIAALEADR